ncbi:hypothetical protein V3C99_007102 [Haemonchus contortus]
MANENWRPMEGESLHHMPNEGEEMVLPWPQIVFATITFITLPVYILILIAICRHQKLSTFYVLMLSQGVADILALLSYFFLATLRVSGWFVEFYWNNQAILANAQFVFIYFTAYIRCVGITLISLQRYATVCLNGNSRGKIISEIPSPLYVMVHWTTAILLISPICTSFHSYYNSPNTLDIVNPPEMLALASLMMFVAVVVFFSISMVCYAQVFFHILHYNYFTNSVNSQELRLCIQATGLLVAFVLLFLYHVGQFVINHINDLPLLFTWRLFHPLVTGFVSWVQPWMCLAFNSDVREHVLKILFCRREQLPTHTGGSVVSAAKPPSRFVLPAIDEKKLSSGAK